MILDSSYDTKTLDELHAELVVLGTQVAQLSDKRQAIFALMDKRKADAKATAHVSRLSVVEKDALKRVLESGRTR